MLVGAASLAAGLVTIHHSGRAFHNHVLAATVHIDTPETHKHRSYDYLRLRNGIQVILASDPKCDKAAAALCVGVGRLHEPKDTPGLAHFCEHMLFLGTKKFPDEAEYKKFIKGHGGKCNAATGDALTTYAFDVAPKFLVGVLDRFSEFFLTPSFTPSATEREINAVDSEHSMRITDDGRRSYATLLLDANPLHPLHWGSGNAHTLRDVPRERGSDPHQEVVKFYESNYTSEDMTLAVLGRESLQELVQIVKERFEDVRSTGQRALRGDEHGGKEPAVKPQDFVGLVLRTPTKDVRTVDFSWQLHEWQVPLWATKPCGYIAFLLGHEGKGSLLSVLKAKGWATALSAGEDDFSSFSHFAVTINLTESGLDHVQEIGVLLFSFIKHVKTLPVQPWVLNEMLKVREVRFRFADDSQPYALVNRLAKNLQNYPPEQVLAGPSKLFATDANASSKILEALTVNSVRVELTAKRLEDRCTNVDPWYHGHYLKLPLDEKWLHAWSTAEAHISEHGLSLPSPNPFIPESLELRPVDSSQTSLEEVALNPNGSLMRCFHRQVDRFRQPKAYLAFRFHTPLVAKDVAEYMRCQLWCKSVVEELNEFAYDAQQAGLAYSLASTDGGLQLSVSGFSDKLPVLLRAILRKMQESAVVPPATFAIVHDRFERGLKNTVFKQRPCDLAARKTTDLLSNFGFSAEECLQSLQNMSGSDLAGENGRLFDGIHIEALTMGNLDTHDAAKTGSILSEELTSVVSSKVVSTRAEATLPQGYTVWRISGTNPEERNNAVRLVFQIPKTLENSVYTALLERVLSTKFFEELRTKQQLGYIVQLSSSESRGFLRINCNVQTEYSPDYVRSRIDAFFEEYLKWVEDVLDESEFNRQRDGLSSNLAEEPKNLGEEFGRYWIEIAQQRYDFKRRDAKREAVDMAELSGLRSFVQQVVRAAPRLYVQILSISGQPMKEASDISSVPKMPDRIWESPDDIRKFRENTAWLSHDWSSEDVSTMKRAKL